MSPNQLSQFEAAQQKLIAALDGHSADDILVCCEELEAAAEQVRLFAQDKEAIFSKQNIKAIEDLNLAARYRIRFLHDMCRARLFMIANQSGNDASDVYTRN